MIDFNTVFADHGWWLVSRASGIVALVLVTVSVGIGLTMASKQWTYRAATYAPESKDALKRYRTFTDRYAELNAKITGSPPPGLDLRPPASRRH